MMKVQRLHHILLLIIPGLLLALLLPFLLAFDSIMYMVTRPTCLNCGSLAEYVRNSSLSAVMVGGMINQLGHQYGGHIKEAFAKVGLRFGPTGMDQQKGPSALNQQDFQLKKSSHD
jgi:hypothetical protein